MNEIDKIAFIIWFEAWGEGDWHDVEEATIQRLLQKWHGNWMPYKNKEHSGDCTQEPWTCTRCLMDEYYKRAEILHEVLNK